MYEKFYFLDKQNKIKEIYKKASEKNKNLIKSFKILNNLNFIEFPKLGFQELSKIIKKISSSSGCLLLIDYGHLNPNNQNTLQSVIKHKKNNFEKKVEKKVKFAEENEYTSDSDSDIGTDIDFEEFKHSLNL